MIAAPGNRRHAFFHQHRRRSRRIEDEKLLAPVPDPLLDEPGRQAELFKRRGARSGSADKTDDGTASACERRRVGTKSLRRVAGAGEPRRDSQMIPLIGEAKAQATGAGAAVHGVFVVARSPALRHKAATGLAHKADR